MHQVTYTDNNGFFRCLAIHQGGHYEGVENQTRKLKKEFEEHTGKNFENGITLGDTNC
jgi:hypothetical protein